MSKTYEIMIHWKQGDDLRQHLEQNSDNPVEALFDWAAALQMGVEAVKRLATQFQAANAQVSIHADTHHIGLIPEDDDAVALLERLSMEGLVQCQEFEDDDDLEEDDDVIDIGDHQDSDVY